MMGYLFTSEITYTLIGFIITFVIELICSLIIFTRLPKTIIVKSVLAANLITFPLLNTFLYLTGLSGNVWNTSSIIMISEIVVILIEGLIYYQFVKASLLKSYINSLVCNTASYLLGSYVVFSIALFFYFS